MITLPAEPHSIRLTRCVQLLETRIVRSTYRPGGPGFRRLIGQQSRWIRALVYDPQALDVYDRAVINALALARERPAW